MFCEKPDGQVVRRSSGAPSAARYAIGREGGTEGISAERVGVVVVGATADVGNADAELDQVAAARPRDHVGEAEVVFGAERVVLGGTADEVAGDRNARGLHHVGVVVEIVLADD